MAAVLETIPLEIDDQGVYRVGGARVALDLVIRAFERGATAEEIVQRFPSLALSDTCQVIGYYLKNRTECQDWLRNREEQARDLTDSHPEWSPAGLRERLRARRNVA